VPVCFARLPSIRRVASWLLPPSAKYHSSHVSTWVELATEPQSRSLSQGSVLSKQGVCHTNIAHFATATF
jgi:hypothetical protein